MYRTGWNIMISEFNQIKHTLECLRSWAKNSWSSQSWKCLNGKSWIYLHRIMLPHNLAETIWVVNGDGFTVSYGYGTTSDERNQYNNYFNLHQNIPMYHIGWNIMIQDLNQIKHVFDSSSIWSKISRLKQSKLEMFVRKVLSILAQDNDTPFLR